MILPSDKSYLTCMGKLEAVEDHSDSAMIKISLPVASAAALTGKLAEDETKLTLFGISRGLERIHTTMCV